MKKVPSEQTALFHDQGIEVAEQTGSAELGHEVGRTFERLTEEQERHSAEILTEIDQTVARQAHRLLELYGRVRTGAASLQERKWLISEFDHLDAVQSSDRHPRIDPPGYEKRRYRDETPDDYRDRTFIEQGVAKDLAAIQGASSGDPDTKKVRSLQNETAPETRERRKQVIVDRRLARNFGDIFTELRDQLESTSNGGSQAAA
ncbi:MAG: hypothetical protein M3N59_02955 [bacterium]|nr:hypothetical protein [bacterium]